MGHEILHVGREKYVLRDRKRMVGIHQDIIENERENLHQLTGARDEVFALVLDDLSVDSDHPFSIIGEHIFLHLHAQFHAPN